MPSVRVRENEYFDAALRRFKRACEKAGVLTELGAANSTKSRLRNGNARRPPP